MKLVKNAGKIARRSHSMWGYYLSAALLVAPDFIYLGTGRDFSPKVYYTLAALIIAYGVLGRIKDQGIGDA